jgi:hypothetical protein
MNDWKQLDKFREFLETAPLYKKDRFSLPEGFHRMIPPSLKLYCASDKSIQTFRDAGTKSDPRVQDDEKKHREAERDRLIRAQGAPGRGVRVASGPKSIILAPDGIYTLQYICSACLLTPFLCWVEVSQVKNWIQKIGQYPPWDISIPRDVEKALGDSDTVLLKHALASLRETYGIGACIYLRRVLENQLNRLLEVCLESRIAEKAPPEELEFIRRTINTVVAEEKIRLISKTAASAIPTFASNPIKITYVKLSDGLHNKSDAECVDIAQAAHGVLIRLLVDLKKEQENQQEYKKNIQKLSEL